MVEPGSLTGVSIRPSSAVARDVRLAVVALSLVQFVDVLGATVVVTALPSLLAAFRVRAAVAA
jgi:hypothetical protein